MNFALTSEQQQFAAEHHNLIYAFLNRKGLKEDEYYDIVCFGYLQAVKRYFNEPLLKKYAFTTIAWQNMLRDMSNHIKKMSRQKRNVDTISIHSSICENDGRTLTREEVIPGVDSLMADFETDLLLHDIASRVSKRQMNVIRLKYGGYSNREIAKSQKMKVTDVDEMLKNVRGTVYDACYE